MINDIKYSHRKNKRFKVLMDNNDIFHFGLKNGETYIDHIDTKKRDNYVKRHLKNTNENDLISNIIPSPALFSAVLLWGPYKTLQENAHYLNNLFKMKEKDKDFKLTYKFI